MKKNTWLDHESSRQSQLYLDGANDFVVERETTRSILVQLFDYRFSSKEGLRLLDLGCGNGFITEEICRMHPNNSFTLLDGNKGMLEQARKLLHGDNFEFINATLEEYFLQPRDSYDFVYSANAIHHLSLRDKTRLYQSIYKILNSGGLFVNIDVVLPPSELCEQWQFDLWRNWMRLRQISKGSDDPDRYKYVPEEFKDKEENQPSDLIEQLSILRDIGFQNVDCYSKYGMFAVFGGTK